MPRRCNDDLNRDLGARLREVRTGRGWTQERLAHAVGVQAAAISRYESGRHGFTLATLHELATALGVRLADLTDFGAPVPTAADLAPETAEFRRVWAALDEHQRSVLLKVVRAFG